MERIESLSKNELMKELKSFKKYETKTNKEIKEKLGDDKVKTLRGELMRLETRRLNKKSSKKTKSPTSTKVKNQTPQEKSHTSAKLMLQTILLNEDTEKILDEYVLTHLQNNPHILNQYLDQHLMYYVFFRLQDADTNATTNANNKENITLVKTFATKKSAEAWVLKNGADIVGEQEENWGEGIVLTIIPYDNNGVYGAGEEPFHAYTISERKWPTYAFSKDGYKMLKKELKYHGIKDDQHIHYIH